MNTEQLFDMWMEYNFGETGDWTPTTPNKNWLNNWLDPVIQNHIQRQPLYVDFLEKFLGKKIQVSADLWAKLDMKL